MIQQTRPLSNINSAFSNQKDTHSGESIKSSNHKPAGLLHIKKLKARECESERRKKDRGEEKREVKRRNIIKVAVRNSFQISHGYLSTRVNQFRTKENPHSGV